MAQKRRIAVIDRQKFDSPQLAYECVKVCPEVRMGRNAISLDPEGMPVIDESLCTGCGLCVKRAQEGAIKIVNLVGELDTPSYQYGPNTFRLYGFLLPKENAVVGIIGVNGIGKTTAVNLMRGSLTPNMGNYANPPSFEQIKLAVRGQEIQGYLQKLKEGKISFSHKLQDVNKLASGKTTARELLSATAPDKASFEATCTQFNLSAILDRLTSQLSGGELQRLAIACCLGKEAHVYCLDEPSSYLDVSERLKAAKAIKSKSDTRPMVVVEHDLALLDYLSDYVHVLYGFRGAYGVVSQLKGSRNGVNDFLAGYLPEENVRFRDHQIRFSAASHLNTYKGLAAFDYPPFSKTFKGFRMSAQQGKVHESEIIGILGPNASGKTTFIRMLAGELESDEGTSGLGKKAVSYKPQYLSQDFEGSVLDYLASDPAFDAGVYSSELRTALSIDELEEKNVRDLSGGELQRTSVALCLSRKADIYLLDEPSAFLDVEQRLRVAEILRRMIADSGKNAFVIDHDLVLVDSVSDRLVVFSGTPSVEGTASAPVPMREGMNSFLKSFEITFRRDESTGRPRANKEGSQKDSEQKKSGEYYYE